MEMARVSWDTAASLVVRYREGVGAVREGTLRASWARVELGGIPVALGHLGGVQVALGHLGGVQDALVHLGGVQVALGHLGGVQVALVLGLVVAQVLETQVVSD